MKMHWVALSLVTLLSACSSSPQVPKQIETMDLNQIVESYPLTPANIQMYQYGYDQACSSALTGEPSPDSAWLTAPKNHGSQSAFIDGWRHGYKRCQNGLGPAQIPAQSAKLPEAQTPPALPPVPTHTKPVVIHYKNISQYGYDQGCKNALQGTLNADKDYAQAPKGLAGSKQDYINAFSKGFQKCRIGLGPVIINKQ
ncbi:hypothetical protein [Shewanella marina]|uniref:hypothetical protein n=1 Tax=Shewanella marina TaxID=487319 RepID=UPI00046E6783|nr:hypothetical protein [Shewanella marina]